MAAHRRTSSMDSNPEWDTRADVLYHFYAYHYFAPKSTGLDLINLTDADVQFYNRIADMTRGLTSQYKLAQYLQTHHELCQTTITTLANALPNSTLTPPAGGENGYRFEFLSHVQDYNSTVEPRKPLLPPQSHCH
ncbi:hypothetical protein G7Y89_g9053 [Cudoniella acicularis]|uniref:Uncharacterized protein n=1 Tax=Cudoniella acicularis TaxID=354080 RepID=A0A8H4RI70_9HELO|nr:hypothetical protein G7Y89_g9053 [Cudoniella acicularis]